MDIFNFRDGLVEDYADYVKSFVNIRDERIRDEVSDAFASGRLWPQPLLQLNPSFETGGPLQALVDEGALHPRCADIFRFDKSATDARGKPMTLHRHQVEAIRVARGGHPYVVTTGTGSGKSLTYIIPTVDRILREGSGKGVKAIIVYPMNALANSQMGELQKFVQHGFGDEKPVTFARYTGQESDEQKKAIIASPPDILLTNYVMLELILTRPAERGLVEAARGLEYLVFDELHTYRGRQGADVALLIRRLRERVGAGDLQCVGTSATMSSEGNHLDKQRAVARVASKIFGVEVADEHVIGETLTRVTAEVALDDPEVEDALRKDVASIGEIVDGGYERMRRSTLASWVETMFGIERESDTSAWVRSTPRRLHGDDAAAVTLARQLGLDANLVTDAVERLLLAGSDAVAPNGRPLFAFRLHQFISKGEAVYATPDEPDRRHVTLDAQRFAPGQRDRASLLPLAFCRECGHEYYTVWRGSSPDGTLEYTPRRLSDRLPEGDDLTPGFLYASADRAWPEDEDDAKRRLPDDWLEMRDGDVEERVKPHYRQQRPTTVTIDAEGREGRGGKRFQWIEAPFRFCLSCGVSYPGKRNDFAKLNVFSSEGRSTSTTILALAAVQRLMASDFREEARKLLSFTDNRQDAALQAGHLNDFVEVGLLRASLHQAAVDAGPDGLAHDVIGQRVFEIMALPFEEYASDPTVVLGAKRQTDETLRSVLSYRLFQDLKRGWRLNAPNLEQVGLLEIQYEDLAELCAADEYWQGVHPALSSAAPATREAVAKVLLDVMRRNLAIFAQELDRDAQESLRRRSDQWLAGPWSLHPREQMEYASVVLPRSRSENDPYDLTFVSGHSGFGRFLRRDRTLPHWGERLSVDETETVIHDLLETLRKAGLVHVALEPRKPDQVPGYQVRAGSMRWHAGSGTPAHDPLIMVRPADAEAAARANAFFARFYQEVALELRGVRAAEHTAQVSTDERQDREDAFREGRLPVLFCSPTMELGVDIASLNVVNLRNVPPTPANYAQRSGRAGRSGQPALVFTYCSTTNSHDQYFFQRQEQMVAGAVAPPRLDLANEELLRAHVHAIWLSETGADLKRSLAEVIDASDPDLPLLPKIAADVGSEAARRRARERAERVLKRLDSDLGEAGWYHDGWLDETLLHVRERFDRTADRWRGLYRAALAQIERQNRVIMDASATQQARNHARRMRREAEMQQELLIDSKSAVHSDFFSYRYFASEGFLPGYSFPRLPLSAFIPARVSRSGREEWVSRPRFLAVHEFGPGAVIYHDGGKYRVNRVLLSPTREGEDRIGETSVKRCPNCGYLHPVDDQRDHELCERCDARLDAGLSRMLRMQNVSTKRLERISSDEEERQRLGYDVITGVRFAVERGTEQRRSARILDGDDTLATLEFGPAATLWRINLGWRHRENKNDLGFAFDTEKGFWSSDKKLKEQDEHLEEDTDPVSPSLYKVIPFVEDRRNTLLWTPEGHLDTAVFASLQAALKSAIQVEYQLEDSELAVEPLPDPSNRKTLLFYEAAEGGAGVLRSLTEDPNAIHRVARRALDLLHFDPDTLDDLGHAPHAVERCEAACYDCLMSYGNQRDHRALDRFAVKPHLVALLDARTETSPTPASRAQHLDHLRRMCDSDLERRFLDLLAERGLRLPDSAQRGLEAGSETRRPDFLYEPEAVAVFIDGPHHDYPDQRVEDDRTTALLMDAGYSVLRFHHQADWDALLREHAYLFGSLDGGLDA